MSTENLHIILFSIPLYQLLYFTTQVVIARKYSSHRILAGMLLLLTTTLAVLNGFAFYQPHNLIFYKGLFYILFVMGVATFFFYNQQVARNEKKISPTLIVKQYTFPIIFSLVWVAALIVANGFSDAEILSPEDPVSGVMTSKQILALVFSAIAMIYLVVKTLFHAPFLFTLTLSRNKPIQAYNHHENQKTFLPELHLLFLAVFIPLLLFHVPGLLNDSTFIVIYNITLLMAGGMMGHHLARILNTSPVNVITHEKTQNNPARNIQNNELAIHKNNSIHLPLLTKEEEQMLLDKLERVMQEKKPYTNPRFGLDDFCILLDINKRKAGYLIGQVLNNSFYGLINEYRVQESIKLLENDDNRKFTIETIALMSGFQSKSSFYSAFKKYKNLTPGEYKEANSV